MGSRTPLRRSAILSFLPVADTAGDDEQQRADAEFMRSVLASSDDCIKVLDLEANLIFMSEGGMRVMDVSDFNAINGCPWPDFWQGQGNVDAQEAVRVAQAGGTGRFQGGASTMIGTPKWWDVQVTPIRDAQGRPEKLLSISRDITELKNAQEQQHFLMQEMAHRMKNMLAMVQAISSQTFRGDVSIADAKDAFSARLMALAKAQDVLLGDMADEASLRQLVEVVQGTYVSGEIRIAMSGPELTLGPKAAVAVSLALHELATNAIKYGALSNETGRVVVSWSVEADRFRLRWQESGGPPVSPPGKTGFGSRMIKHALEQSEGVSVEVSYLPDGVRFELDAPVGFLRHS